MPDNQHIVADAIARVLRLADAYRKEMALRVVAQREMLDGLLTALIAGGHVLLEGAPGLAKTLAVKCLASVSGLSFKRVQFTPDLLPADLTGSLVWEPGTGAFSMRKGPIFAHLVLADEINRAPAKVQSALLEAMEERQVTIGERTLPLPDPFFVLATQNPVEHEGTYPLPEAQLDRFLLKLKVDYPSPEDELQIVRMQADPGQSGQTCQSGQPEMRALLGAGELAALRTAAASVYIDEQIERYIVSIVAATRPAREKADGGKAAAGKGRAARERVEGADRYIVLGASPRASIALHRCAKIRALLDGSGFVRPEDVKASALPVLRHRLVLSFEAEADGLDADAVIERVLAAVPAP